MDMRLKSHRNRTGKTSMSRKSWGSILCALAFALCLSGLALGQEITGSIVGTVKDASGSVVPGATVTISDPSKGDIAVRTVTTNDDGEFSAPSLAVSTYKITVEMANFKKAVNTDITLNVGQRRTVDVILEAGNIDEIVTVVADPVAVGVFVGVFVGVPQAPPPLVRRCTSERNVNVDPFIPPTLQICPAP